MELKDFIKAALIDLITAVDEAKNEVEKNNSLICPPIAGAFQKDVGIFMDINGRFFQKVEFDIAVSAGEEIHQSGKAEGKVSIKVLGGSVNVDSSLTENTTKQSRIKFHIPIALQCISLKEE